MRNSMIFAIAISFINCAYSQNVGIDFREGLSLDSIQVIAKKENKSIFLDCFATWCVPCKNMERNVFSQKKVSEYFNEHFISVRVQMDK
jgi:thiol:disulfide interchange protein